MRLKTYQDLEKAAERVGSWRALQDHIRAADPSIRITYQTLRNYAHGATEPRVSAWPKIKAACATIGRKGGAGA